MQETRQNRISRLLQKELSLIFQSQTRMMHGSTPKQQQPYKSLKGF